MLKAMHIQQIKSFGLILFLDVNETLIRTGPTSAIEASEDIENLFALKSVISRIGAKTRIHVVLISGNTFEYLRRVEEPLGLAKVPNLMLGIVSENGLVARMNQVCPSWSLDIGNRSKTLLRDIENSILSKYSDLAFLQPNEIRATIKPTFGQFSIDEINKILFDCFHEHLPDKLSWGTLRVAEFTVNIAPFYIDIDPIQFHENGRKQEFKGKEFAIERILENCPEMLPIGFGDSESDAAIIEKCVSNGGLGFQVANSLDRWKPKNAIPTKSGFGKGVVEVLDSIASEIE